MSERFQNEYFQKITDGMLRNRHVRGAAFCVESGDNAISWVGASGNIQPHDRYFIASVTKLYVTAVMIMLRNQGKLQFSDAMHTYFAEELIHGIHVLNGTDHTREITIAHLLSNTSGIPDYYYYDKAKGEAASDLLAGNDEAWPLERAIEKAKTIKPKFKPGQAGKVHYSDTNYQLLGGIIEKVTGQGMGEVFQEYIFAPMNLQDTYAFSDIEDRTPVSILYKTREIHAPRYMASVTAEGGIVSTARECMQFLKGFFNGSFFPEDTIGELTQKWNMIYFPGQFFFGLGLEKLWTPRILSPFKPIGDILGFWGQTGAFAFHHPGQDLYFTGTINQVSGMGHSAAFNGVLRVIKDSL
jgi:D-alanyl-D-alanine carboxypeptidase